MKRLLIAMFVLSLIRLGVMPAWSDGRPTVTITPFALVPTNTSVGVEVVILPPPQDTFTLEIRNLDGSGAAPVLSNIG